MLSGRASWECILNKREAFRAAFDEFDLDKVCGYDEAKEEALRTAPGIVHNRLKIHGRCHECTDIPGNSE